MKAAQEVAEQWYPLDDPDIPSARELCAELAPLIALAIDKAVEGEREACAKDLEDFRDERAAHLPVERMKDDMIRDDAAAVTLKYAAEIIRSRKPQEEA